MTIHLVLELNEEYALGEVAIQAFKSDRSAQVAYDSAVKEAEDIDGAQVLKTTVNVV